MGGGGSSVTEINCLSQMLSLLSSSPAFVAPAVPHVAVQPAAAAVLMVSKEQLAEKLNPAIGYFDPIGLGSADFWSQGNEATYGFLRHAEIKHGRVAMAAFVGYIVQSNGIHFPFPFTLDGLMPYEGSPPEQWDNLPFAGKCQIILFIGFLEWWGEFGGVHYMRGGVPGKYPEFKDIPVHKIPSLYDPLGFNKKMTPEKSEQGKSCQVSHPNSRTPTLAPPSPAPQVLHPTIFRICRNPHLRPKFNLSQPFFPPLGHSHSSLPIVSAILLSQF